MTCPNGIPSLSNCPSFIPRGSRLFFSLVQGSHCSHGDKDGPGTGCQPCRRGKERSIFSANPTYSLLPSLLSTPFFLNKSQTSVSHTTRGPGSSGPRRRAAPSPAPTRCDWSLPCLSDAKARITILLTHWRPCLTDPFSRTRE